MQDKVNISVAIIPMAQDFGWSPTVAGLVQSSFFYGYALTQIPGGYVTSRIGGRKVLPAGVSLWSAATAAVPLLAGTIPGVFERGRRSRGLRKRNHASSEPQRYPAQVYPFRAGLGASMPEQPCS